MPSPTINAPVFVSSRDSDRGACGRVLFAGIMLLVLGTTAVIHNSTGTLASTFVFGSLLMRGGFRQIEHARQVAAIECLALTSRARHHVHHNARQRAHHDGTRP